jgi:hypothetical protein
MLSMHFTISKFLIIQLGLMKFPNIWSKATSVVNCRKNIRMGQRPTAIGIAFNIRDA